MDMYLTSHQLMVHESFMPRGQRYALAKLSLFGGFGTTVGGATPDNVFYDLGEHLTLKEVDFQIDQGLPWGRRPADRAY